MASTADLLEDESVFFSDYRVFVNAVEMTAMPPEQQCETMGDFNVAWELKHDVEAGKLLTGRGYLSAVQEAWILALVGAVQTVPEQVLPAGSGRERNLVAMRHPSWVPLRAIAAHVLDSLQPFTEANAGRLEVGDRAT